MATRMGVKEFRDNFTAIARDAKAPVIVTNHDKVIGYYTPANRDPHEGVDWTALERHAAEVRRKLEERGVKVADRLKSLGIEDEAPFDDPWIEGNPGRPEMDPEDEA